MDALLGVLAERGPDFRVVFREDFHSFRRGTRGEPDAVRRLIEGYLPLVCSKGLVKFEEASLTENRFWRSGIF